MIKSMSSNLKYNSLKSMFFKSTYFVEKVLKNQYTFENKNIFSDIVNNQHHFL